MTGIEWIVEARGCEPRLLADLARLQSLFARMIAELDLHPVGNAQWHQFPSSEHTGEGGGIAGLCLLAESHLTIHTFPEHGSMCLNLFCCRPRPEWDFRANLQTMFEASEINIRIVQRDYSAAPVVVAAKVTR